MVIVLLKTKSDCMMHAGTGNEHQVSQDIILERLTLIVFNKKWGRNIAINAI